MRHGDFVKVNFFLTQFYALNQVPKFLKRKNGRWSRYKIFPRILKFLSQSRSCNRSGVKSRKVKITLLCMINTKRDIDSCFVFLVFAQQHIFLLLIQTLLFNMFRSHWVNLCQERSFYPLFPVPRVAKYEMKTFA